MNAAVAHRLYITCLTILKQTPQTRDRCSTKDLSITKHSTVTVINSDDNNAEAVKKFTAK